MKTKYIFSIALASVLVLGGCKKFDEVNTNPNVTTSGNSAMLATGLLRTMTTCSGNGVGKNFVRDEYLAKALSWTESSDIDLAFNLLERADFDDISSLINAQKMIDAATSDGLKNSYEGLAHFIRVWVFYNATMRVGDIPYSDALKGEEDVYFPTYDTQKKVFLGLLDELDQADALFAKGETFSGDFLYSGDCTKWRKACNVFQLKLLINLYRKESDSDVQLKQRFNTILTSRPIFESIDDNLQVVYSNKANQKYPMNADINSYCYADQMTNLLVDKLKDLGDYRLFAYADPTPNAKKSGADLSAWDSYNGVEPCQPESDIQTYVGTGNVSGLNARYEEVVDCEPSAILCYQEMNFILAEAAARGFISGNAADYYAEGIRASMQFTAAHSSGYTNGRNMTSEYIENYIKSDKVAFASTLDKQINQIIWQKYIATFMQIPYNQFFEYRRTGVPEIKIDPRSNLNDPSDKMPLRWMYPTSELSYNMENVSAAIQSQYGGSDDYMGIMWILQ